MNTRKELIRFFVAGAIVGAIDYGTYYLLINFFSFDLSKGIAFTCAGIVAYLFNKYWTFKNDQSSFGEVGRYVMVNLFALGVNVLTNQRMLSVWPDVVLFALVIASAATALFTFICFKWWVFRSQLTEFS